MARQGLFVTLEGIDGCGKSTKARMLGDALRSLGHEVVALREPGGTPLSEKIRTLVLNPAHADMTDECELLLMEASRAQLVRQVVGPALARGAVVVCDRFYDSTYAYQAGARGLPEEMVRAANELGSCGVVPDRTIVFDIDPSHVYGHPSQERADRMEAEGRAFQERVRAAYLRLATVEPARVRVIDGMGSVEEVYDRLAVSLSDLFPRLLERRGHV